MDFAFSKTVQNGEVSALCWSLAGNNSLSTFSRLFVYSTCTPGSETLYFRALHTNSLGSEPSISPVLASLPLEEIDCRSNKVVFLHALTESQYVAVFACGTVAHLSCLVQAVEHSTISTKSADIISSMNQPRELVVGVKVTRTVSLGLANCASVVQAVLSPRSVLYAIDSVGLLYQMDLTSDQIQVVTLGHSVDSRPHPTEGPVATSLCATGSRIIAATATGNTIVYNAQLKLLFTKEHPGDCITTADAAQDLLALGTQYGAISVGLNAAESSQSTIETGDGAIKRVSILGDRAVLCIKDTLDVALYRIDGQHDKHSLRLTKTAKLPTKNKHASVCVSYDLFSRVLFVSCGASLLFAHLDLDTALVDKE